MSEFLVKLGKNGSEIREILVQVYGDNAMKKMAVCKWVIHFSEGRESVTDEERSGRLATSRTEENIAKICQIVCENRSTAEQANIDRETVRSVLTEDLDMRKVCKNGPKGPVHMALSVREFLASKEITVLEHPPCSPDLAPLTFLLFPKVKEILKGKHSDDTDDIRSNMMAALKANCIEGWTRHWHWCIASQGEYFEGDHSDIQQ
ncbi:hypothetical protein B7P43_G08889 [Cryptotermes secundus]|uniref:Mos1 transposase HTH domain-containing protein n=1 Tax=Cryptotermes secundus TaxID=105785 RepID=A0A2J7Q0G6_9NEOP|nr:hypothetical protein B7P43_G08889 [Cryptotermes secundus]